MSEILQNPSRRKLGDQERYLHNIHKLGALIAATVLDIEGPLDEKLVRRGLDWLQRRHPILQAHLHLKGFGTTPEFPWVFRQPWLVAEGTGPIPLDVMTDADEEAINQRIDREMRTPITGRKSPRMRFVLASHPARPDNHKLIIIADHTVADAQANSMCMRELLEFFADPAWYEKDAPRYGLPPALEERTPPKPDSGTKAHQPAIVLPAKFTRPHQRGTRVVKSGFSRVATSALKQALKRERATMHGLLTASLLQALGNMFDVSELTTLSNVELRRMCEPALPSDMFGCYIDALRTRHDLDKPVWDLAREVSFKLISTLVHDRATASMMKMPTWDVYRNEFPAIVKAGMRMDALAVTTAGESGLKRHYGNLTLNDIRMNMSLHIIGVTVFLMSIELDGELQLQLGYTHPNISDEQARELLRACRKQLDRIAEQAMVDA